MAKPSRNYLFPNEISYKRSYKVDYDITDNLGSGAFGVVRKARSKEDPSLYVAIKSIKKADCKPEELFAEVKLLRLLAGSKGIVHMYAVYESFEKVNIVMELISGGELFDAILENEFYSELEASKIVKQIASIVEYLHSKNIVHRDLKPENLLFSDKQNNILKLIDFGIATIVDPGKKLMEVVGSRSYMAPEIHMRTGYHKPVDVYAIGVITYILLCGYPPFDYDQGIYELAFNSPEWDDISDNAKDLISNLLQDDPNKRMTAASLMKHSWLQGVGTSKTPLGANLKGTLKGFRDYNNLVSSMAAQFKQDGRGSVRGRPAGDTIDSNKVTGIQQPAKDARRMSIFGAFNIVKETKELEALQKQDNTKLVDFEQDARDTQQSKGNDKNPGLYSNPKNAQTRPDSQKNVVGNQRERANAAPPVLEKPKEKQSPPPVQNNSNKPSNPLNSNSNAQMQPSAQNNSNTSQPSKSNQSNAPSNQGQGEKSKQEQEVETINNLKNDLRQHGKAFNKLKQDLIAYSRTTDNDMLKRQLLKSAEEINILTNSYKSTFDTIIPVLNKASQICTTNAGTQ